MAEAARKLEPVPTPYRSAPNNIEAEQALLGAILVNNDAFYRVSDFLKPQHFQEPLHRKIYEVAGDLIRLNKTANPVTMKTFLPAEEKVGDHHWRGHGQCRLRRAGRHDPAPAD
jgi:replicative DNA helicase